MYICAYIYVRVTKTAKQEITNWRGPPEREEVEGGNYVDTVLMYEIPKSQIFLSVQ